MPLFGSFTSEKDPVYKDSKKQFKKRALFGDFSDREEGTEIIGNKKDKKVKLKDFLKMQKKLSSKKPD